MTRAPQSTAALIVPRNKVTFGFLKMTHEVDDFFGWNLSYDIAGFYVYDLDHPNPSVFVLIESQSQTVAIDDQFDGRLGVRRQYFVIGQFRLY